MNCIVTLCTTGLVLNVPYIGKYWWPVKFGEMARNHLDKYLAILKSLIQWYV